MFEVYLESAGGIKRYFTEFESEGEAQRFCEENNWEWLDENAFMWHMNYREV